MELLVEWSKPITLKDGSKHYLTYELSDKDLNKISFDGGIYVFGRRYGSTIKALYVGQATNLQKRIKQQLNNAKLMNYLKGATKGNRVLLYGKAITKPGQTMKKFIAIVERTLIRHFLSEGCDLANKQGTRVRKHEIVCKGKQPKKFIPSRMYSK